jgi:hypothetical protein
VTYSATATDARDANLTVTCTPASGSLFAFGATTVNCSATNSRNKTAQGSFTVTVVDTTPPVVTLGGITGGATYTLGAVPAASCSTTDSASGVAVAATLSITGGTANGVGEFTATCSGAKDNAGNLASPVSATYSVGYVFSGFVTDMSLNGEGNVSGEGGLGAREFRINSTIPVKWLLENAQGGVIMSASAVKSVQVAPDPSCLPGQQGPAADAAFTGNGLQALDGHYQFNWNTAGLAPGCYAFLVTLDDGAVESAVVSLR